MPSLTVSYSNGVITYSYSGFTPLAGVVLTVVETGGYWVTYADSNGSGSGTLQDSDSPGTYHLDATDYLGNDVTKAFVIPSTSNGWIQVGNTLSRSISRGTAPSAGWVQAGNPLVIYIGRSAPASNSWVQAGNTLSIQVSRSAPASNNWVQAGNTYSITVARGSNPNPPSPTQLSIVTSSLPAAVVGTAYKVTLKAQGGQVPYLWILGADTLPSGLVLSQDGIISGTPKAANSTPAQIIIDVTDSQGNIATKVLTLSVSAGGASSDLTVVGVAAAVALAAGGALIISKRHKPEGQAKEARVVRRK